MKDIFKIIVIVLMSSILFSQSDVNIENEKNNSEYQCYSEFINSRYTTEPIVYQNKGFLKTEKTYRKYSIIIQSETENIGSDYSEQDIKCIFKDIQNETIENYLVKNNEVKSIIVDNISTDIYPAVISKNTYKEIFDNGWYEEFYSVFPSSYGYLTLSRVGLNNDNTQALFSFSVYHMPRAAQGGFILLEKNDDKWNIVNIRLIWKS